MAPLMGGGNLPVAQPLQSALAAALGMSAPASSSSGSSIGLPPAPPRSIYPGAQQVSTIDYSSPVRQQSTATGEGYEGRLPGLSTSNTVASPYTDYYAALVAAARGGRKIVV
jgi:hypothetical protein